MIISVSGRIGSGKDTVAEIIQQITPYHNWEVKKFAGKLKQIASLLTGIPVAKFEDQEFKKTFLPKEWNVWRVRFVRDNEQCGSDFVTEKEAKKYERNERISLQWSSTLKTKIVEEQMTVREFLQKLGTEGLRSGLHQNVWVNSLFSDYITPAQIAIEQTSGYSNQANPFKFPNWLITDTRFPNELDAVRNHQATCIRVVRPSTETPGGHISETALNYVQDWDYVIMNDGTLKELEQKVLKVLEELKLVEYAGI